MTLWRRTLLKSFMPGLLSVAWGSLSYGFEIPAGIPEGFPLDPSLLPDINSYVSAEVVNPFIKTIGLGWDYRAYQPATPLGTKPGLDASIEATLTKPPADLSEGLAGAGGGPVELPVIPLARLHLHKGVGEQLEVGFATIWLHSKITTLVWGGDVKYAFWKPEEGPTWAARISYTSIKLTADMITLKTRTITPQLLVSKQMEYADPYIGVGFQYATGTLAVSKTITEIEGTPIPPQTLEVSAPGRARGFQFFTGVQFKFPQVGLALTLEGSYSSVAMHALGLKFGMSF